VALVLLLARSGVLDGAGPVVVPVLHLVVALAVVALARLPWWWWVVQAALPMAIWIGVQMAWSPWVWLVLLVLAILVFGGGASSRVPLYLSRREVAGHLCSLLTPRPGAIAVDLGAGLGGPMRWLARLRPDGQYRNVEASPLTTCLAWILALPHPQVRTVWGGLFQHPIADADLIYVFLSPHPMGDLWDKIRAEAKPGAVLVSNSFPVPGVEPAQRIILSGRTDAVLWVYRISGG
jgi:hypothetical protein